MMALCAEEQILEAYGKEPEGNQAKETGGKTAEKMIKRGRMTLEEIVDYVLWRYHLTIKVNENQAYAADMNCCVQGTARRELQGAV